MFVENSCDEIDRSRKRRCHPKFLLKCRRRLTCFVVQKVGRREVLIGVYVIEVSSIRRCARYRQFVEIVLCTQHPQGVVAFNRIFMAGIDIIETRWKWLIERRSTGNT